ncbi:MAG: TonB-dependent receptor family protein [Ignavibacteria bacterium]|nr:TonB-dependent receptor family protein [Ignavibacteria bacterium]
MIRKILIFTFLLLVLEYFNSYGQNASVKGTVIDGNDNIPLENAVVRIVSAKDTEIKFGMLTDSKGEFEFSNIPNSMYKLSISFIGYADYTNEIKLDKNSPSQDLGRIILQSSQDSTATIEVNAERLYVENRENMKVYNIEKNIISESGTASDVLKSIPSVTVDSEGKVSIRGNSNIVFLVNGNQSGILSTDPASSLDLIPSNIIESIEIISNPSAKYEAEGITGIVNIVLKKSAPKNSGTSENFIISLNAGTLDKYSLSVNANIRREKYSLLASYSFRRMNMKADGHTYTQNYLNDLLYYQNQENHLRNRLTSHTGNIGLDYYLSDNDILNLSASYSNRGRIRSENTLYRNFDINYVPVKYYNRDNVFDISGYGLDISASYKKVFSKDNFLNISSQYSNSKEDLVLGINQTLYNLDGTPADSLPYLENDYTENKFQIANFQADYVNAIENFGKIETGVKSLYRKTDSYFNVDYYDYSINNWTQNLSMTNDFIYDEYINALYGIYSNKYKQFSYQAGIRLEQTNTTAKQLNINFENKKNYLDIFPSVFLKQMVSDNSDIALSYSRRINRPANYMLNPFVNNADPLVLRFGNPDLMPEYINSFELGYNHYFPALTVSPAVFFRNVNDVMTRYIYADTTGRSYFTYRNLDASDTYGAELILNGNISKWWYFNSNLSYLKIVYSGNQGNNNNYETWVGKLYSSFPLTPDFEIQLLFSYQGKTSGAMGINETPQISGHTASALVQGLNEPNYYLDIAFKKDFFDKKLSLIFKLIDVFNTSKYESVIFDTDFYSEYYRKRASRAAFLTLTYRFGSDGKTKNGKKPLLEEHEEN